MRFEKFKMKTEVPLTTGLKASSKMKHFQEPATQFQTPPSFFRGPKALSIPSILRYQQQTVFPFPQQNPSVLQGVLVSLSGFGTICCVHCYTKKTCFYKALEILSWFSIGQQRFLFFIFLFSECLSNLWWSGQFTLLSKLSSNKGFQGCKSSKKRLARVNWEIPRKM